MTKKNTKTSVGSRMDSTEEVVGMLHGELGELKGEMTNLKEYLQQILKNQQEMSRSATFEQIPNPTVTSLMPQPSPLTESSSSPT